ncbi:MAG: hypothetical protein LUF30_09985 [Lachnospiraceae bacterium]|nr:hypothetical protein [Lachnospiraceae bacterium]
MADPATIRAYVKAILREAEATAPDFEDSVVESICFAGGSPTSLDPEDFIEIAKSIRKWYPVAEDAEMTVAVYPNRVDARWMVHFQRAGVNRLSLDLITCNVKDAARIGVPATGGSMENALILPQMFHLRSYEACLNYGFEGQTLQSFRTSLRFAVRYNSPEITLTRVQAAVKPEAGLQTVSGRFETVASQMPDEALIAQMLGYAHEHLTEKGYVEYRPGCWAVPGHERRERFFPDAAGAEDSDYLSFGLGTRSRTDGVLYSTTSALGIYMNHSDEPETIYTVLSRSC